VDPDNHHLFVSLGCATENLVQAAIADGFQSFVGFDHAAGEVVAINLELTRSQASSLFLAIPERQCTRAEYDGKAVANDALRLEEAGSGSGVNVLMLTRRDELEKLLDYVVAANTLQMNDRAFVELKAWIR
jgi:hypothetical protein